MFVLHLFCKMISVSSCHFEIFVHISFYNSLLCLCGNFVRCFILFFLFWYMFLVILYLHFASYSFCDIIILLYYFINPHMIHITPLWLCQLHYCHHPQLILFAYEGWSQEFEVEQTQRSNRNISLPTRVTSWSFHLSVLLWIRRIMSPNYASLNHFNDYTELLEHGPQFAKDNMEKCNWVSISVHKYGCVSVCLAGQKRITDDSAFANASR